LLFPYDPGRSVRHVEAMAFAILAFSFGLLFLHSLERPFRHDLGGSRGRDEETDFRIEQGNNDENG
jgi:hypothetical protein